MGNAPNTQTFHVHTPLLTSNSAFFTAALSPTSGFIESSTNSVTLSEADPRIFALFVQWGYTKSLAHEDIDWEEPAGSESGASTDGEMSRATTPVAGNNDRKEITSDGLDGLDVSTLAIQSTTGPSDAKAKSEKRQRKPPAFFYLIRLYKLAGFLGCETLRNNIIDEVARVALTRNAVPCARDTWELMDEGMGGKSSGGKINGLRGLVIDMFAGMKTSNLIRSTQGWSDEFMKEVVLKMKEREENTLPGVPMVELYKDKKMRCLSYHEHKDTKKCVKWIGDV